MRLSPLAPWGEDGLVSDHVVLPRQVRQPDHGAPVDGVLGREVDAVGGHHPLQGLGLLGEGPGIIEKVLSNTRKSLSYVYNISKGCSFKKAIKQDGWFSSEKNA